jgi:hypothetical protein
MPSPNLRNAGGAWSDDEDETLVQELRDGLDLADIAELHGRSVGAVRSRASLMVPNDEDRPRSQKARVESLREYLAAGEHDWRTPLHVRTKRFAWTPEEERLIREAWEGRTPLVELADALRRSEPMLVRRLRELGLARDLLEIVDRLGCDPNGPLALRVAIQRGDTGPLISVLLGVDEDGRTIHVSLHESEQAAHTLSTAIQEHDDQVVRWQTIDRQIGGPGYTDPSAVYRLWPGSGSTSERATAD